MYKQIKFYIQNDGCDCLDLGHLLETAIVYRAHSAPEDIYDRCQNDGKIVPFKNCPWEECIFPVVGRACKGMKCKLMRVFCNSGLEIEVSGWDSNKSMVDFYSIQSRLSSCSTASKLDGEIFNGIVCKQPTSRIVVYVI